ncbi:MAG: PIN domain-containing protein [Planctomycetales bacterium]
MDTSILLTHWHGPRARRRTAEEARAWAEELVRIHRTSFIVSPVYLEFVCGAQSRGELMLAEAYLSVFEVKDNWEIRPEDLRQAARIARRVPADGSRRQFGDCLIRAMANRLKCAVLSFDARFP